MSDTCRVGGDVAWTSVAGRVVALDLVGLSARPYALEGSAAAVWAEIAEEPGISVDELLRRLSEGFDISEAEIRGDVETLLDELVARNLLIRGVPGEHPPPNFRVPISDASEPSVTTLMPTNSNISRRAAGLAFARDEFACSRTFGMLSRDSDPC